MTSVENHWSRCIYHPLYIKHFSSSYEKKDELTLKKKSFHPKVCIEHLLCGKYTVLGTGIWVTNPFLKAFTVFLHGGRGWHTNRKHKIIIQYGKCKAGRCAGYV